MKGNVDRYCDVAYAEPHFDSFCFSSSDIRSVRFHTIPFDSIPFDWLLHLVHITSSFFISAHESHGEEYAGLTISKPKNWQKYGAHFFGTSLHYQN